MLEFQTNISKKNLKFQTKIQNTSKIPNNFQAIWKKNPDKNFPTKKNPEKFPGHWEENPNKIIMTKKNPEN